MERYENDPQQLIAVLLDIQAASGINCVEKQWAGYRVTAAPDALVSISGLSAT